MEGLEYCRTWLDFFTMRFPRLLSPIQKVLLFRESFVIFIARYYRPSWPFQWAWVRTSIIRVFSDFSFILQSFPAFSCCETLRSSCGQASSFSASAALRRKLLYLRLIFSDHIFFPSTRPIFLFWPWPILLLSVQWSNTIVVDLLFLRTVAWCFRTLFGNGSKYLE